MSEGGTMKERLARVEEELAEEQKLWENAGIPPCPTIFNLGEQQFEIYLHNKMFTELFKELFDADKLELMYKEIVIEELRRLRPIVQQQMRDALRQQIVDGINIVRPNPEI